MTKAKKILTQNKYSDLINRSRNYGSYFILAIASLYHILIYSKNAAKIVIFWNIYK